MDASLGNLQSQRKDMPLPHALHDRGALAILTVLLPLLTSLPVFSADPVRGPNGHFYIAVESLAISWDDANLAAASMSNFGAQGHLATIQSADENQFIDNLRTALVGQEGPTELWLGGYQLDNETEPSGGWFWVNDEGPIEGYTNWGPGEPNNSSVSGEEEFLAMGVSGSSGWNDEGYLGNIAGFMVEFDSGLFADAGPDQEKSSCSEVVQLDGSGSQPDEALINWTIKSKPAESLAAIDDPTTRSPFFIADLPGTYVVQLTVSLGEASMSDEVIVLVSCPLFHRGDSNGAGRTDLSDAIYTLAFLFQTGEPIRCADAADANDDGNVDISDPIYVLGFLYLGSSQLPPPGPLNCGPDLTADQLPECSYLPENC
jgi:hypothetical protein